MMKKSKKMFKMTKHRRNVLIGYSFLSLWIIGFLVFTLYPVILSGRDQFIYAGDGA